MSIPDIEHRRYWQTSHDELDLTKDVDCFHQYTKYLHDSSLECSAKCGVDEVGSCIETLCITCFEVVW